MEQEQWDTDRVFTVPNILSFLRLAAIPVFTWLIIAGHDLAAVIILVASAVTDWFDGFLARKLNQVTKLGAMLDPVTDRLYILATIIALLVRDIVPLWFVTVLLARDVLLLALYPVLRRHGRDQLPVNKVGKAATFALLTAFPVMLLGVMIDVGWVLTVGWAIALLGAVLYWAAGFLYVRALTRIVGEERREVEQT